MAQYEQKIIMGENGPLNKLVGAHDEARALLVLFCSMLNEQQRRLYAGLESLKLGHGGDAHIASILGMDPHTVAKGRKELMGADLTATGRLRAPGAGRPSQEKKHRRS